MYNCLWNWKENYGNNIPVSREVALLEHSLFIHVVWCNWFMRIIVTSKDVVQIINLCSEVPFFKKNICFYSNVLKWTDNAWFYLRGNRTLQCRIICHWFFFFDFFNKPKFTMSSSTCLIIVATVLPCKEGILIWITFLLWHYGFLW